jgi:hypothetical protein
MNLINYGYLDFAIPLDNLGANRQEGAPPAGATINTHKDIIALQFNNQRVYVPFHNLPIGLDHGYFNKNENVILESVKRSIRGPEYIRSWIKVISLDGQKQLSAGTFIEYMPPLGGRGSIGAPLFRESNFFDDNAELNYYFNVHPAAQALNMQFAGSLDLELKTTDSDLDNFYRVNGAGGDFEAHFLYITFIFKFIHSLPVTVTP